MCAPRTSTPAGAPLVLRPRWRARQSRPRRYRLHPEDAIAHLGVAVARLARARVWCALWAPLNTVDRVEVGPVLREVREARERHAVVDRVAAAVPAPHASVGLGQHQCGEPAP